MSKAILSELKKAAQGLQYLSEKDAPWTPFHWAEAGDLTKAEVLAHSGFATNAKIEEVDFEKFFQSLAVEQKWHADPEKAVVRKYQSLLKLLKDKLMHLKIYRVGDTKCRYFVVGRSEDGWTGVAADALET